MYDWIENFFCFGCNMYSDGVVDDVNKTILMCQSYLENVWGAPLSGRTQAYDGCGFNPYWRANPSPVLPSLEWKTGYDFFNECLPPLFQNYRIIIVANNTNCFNSGIMRKVSGFIFFLILIGLIL